MKTKRMALKLMGLLKDGARHFEASVAGVRLTKEEG